MKLVKDKNLKAKFLKAYGRIKKNKQSGFTLIEAMVVMIIGVMVLAGAAAGINKLFVANNVSTEAQNIQTISANMKVVASAEGGFADITSNKEGTALKVFPTNMKIDGEKVKNVWGGEVTIAGVDDTFDLTYNSVPSEECVQIASKLRNAGWNKLMVGADEIKSTTSLSDIQGICDKAEKQTFVFTGH